jgi:hypothetical protein
VKRFRLQYLPCSSDFADARGGAVAEKVVDVFLKDRLVASYPIVLDKLNAAMSEQDFIELARDCLRENGYPAEDKVDSKFSVRSIPE